MKILDELAREERPGTIDTSLSTRTNPEPSEAVEIIDYETQFRDVFRRLTLEWIEHYFSVEEIDNIVLADPEQYILQGGYIFFAKYHGQIVGTCALVKHQD